MNPILFLIAWIVIIITTTIVLIIEIPAKIICSIISIIFLLVLAFVAPMFDKEIKISNKIEKIIENFVRYGISINNWMFIKTFKKYKYILI